MKPLEQEPAGQPGRHPPSLTLCCESSQGSVSTQLPRSSSLWPPEMLRSEVGDPPRTVGCGACPGVEASCCQCSRHSRPGALQGSWRIPRGACSGALRVLALPSSVYSSCIAPSSSEAYLPTPPFYLLSNDMIGLDLYRAHRARKLKEVQSFMQKKF